MGNEPQADADAWIEKVVKVAGALFLHAVPWHLGFNLIAIATIDPRIGALYGRLTMLMLFIVTEGAYSGIFSGTTGT